MTLEEVYLVTQIVSAIAVVASLIFVGVQLRHTANQQQIATAAGYYDIFRDHLKILESPEMIDSFLTGFAKGQDALSPAEQVRLNVFYTMVTRGYQVLHSQAEKNVFDRDFWHHTQQHLADHLASKYYQEFWDVRRSHFPPGFQALMDRLIAEGAGAHILPGAAPPPSPEQAPS